jgi:class 3 adenylate cyclase
MAPGSYDAPMICTACGSPLDPGARFCASCGTAVGGRCASCGASIPEAARFCPACGTPVPGEPTDHSARPSGRERKVATLLFADLVGSTALGEHHDPEIVAALVARTFERLAAEVERYEGTIEKFAGDAMLAVFGVPAIHEDDPERAVRAALEMQVQVAAMAADARAAGRPEPALRIGIETGEVLVDLTRAGGERDLFVTGDAVNTASRLQGLAAPGAIVVGATTYSATRGVVDYEELPPAELKGKALPVAAWRALAVKARRGGRAPLGLEAPLVGRDTELALVKETVRRMVADGRPHLVTVVGAAGVGKSRLTWELEKYLDGLPEDYHWRKGRCLSYAQQSYSALADALRLDMRALEDDPPDVTSAKLDARLAELAEAGEAPDPSTREALLAILGLSATELPRDVLFDGWRLHLEAIARVAPLVLVVEDIHWADEGLLDFIEALARWATAPIMILALARHELLDRRPTWGGGIPNASTIVLAPLSEDQAAALADGLLDGGLPSSLRDRIVSLAEGNPLFTEELVRMFVDRGVLRHADGRWELARPVEEIEVPGSIHAVLAARLDGLPVDEKRLAQDAAVIGRIFWDVLVAHIARVGPGSTGELLRRLRVKELIVPRQPSSLAGASEFGFRHVLIRDVAYDSLPKRDRAALHAAIAGWAEAAMADRADEIVELLAAHYHAALGYEEEIGSDPERLAELRVRTFATARRAAAHAHRLEQLALATHWGDIAMDLAPRIGLSARERAGLADEYCTMTFGHATNERLLAVARRGLEASAEVLAGPDRDDGDDDLDARLRRWAAVYAYWVVDRDAAETIIRDGLAALGVGSTGPARARLLGLLGWLLWRAGPIETAVEPLELAVAGSRACGADEVERWSLHDLGIVHGLVGSVAVSVDEITHSRRLAEVAGDRGLTARCVINLASAMTTNGDPRAQIETATLPGLQRARRSLDRGTQTWAAQNLGDMVLFSGHPGEAEAYYHEQLEAALAISDDVMVAMARLNLGWLAMYRGDRDGGVAMVAAADIGPIEPQNVGFTATFEAWAAWASDPIAAAGSLDDHLRGPLTVEGRLQVGANAARMAFRLSDWPALRRAVEAHATAAAGCSGPIRQLERDWLGALLDPSDAACQRIAAAADELEALDALLPAARIDLDPGPFLEGARRLYDGSGIAPLLGPLPEARWISPPAVSSSD